MNIKHSDYDLPKIIFGILSVLIMLSASFWIVLPFILSFIWAGAIVTATWPVMLRIEKACGGRRHPASLLMVLLLLVLFAFPVILLGNSLAENSHRVMIWLETLRAGQLPDSHFLQQVPVIGGKLYEKWHALASGNGQVLLRKASSFVAKVLPVVLGKLIGIGNLLGHVVLTLIFSGVLYTGGEHVAHGLRHFAFRLGGRRGDNAPGRQLKLLPRGL